LKFISLLFKNTDFFQSIEMLSLDWTTNQNIGYKWRLEKLHRAT
jgi:hypothetical protein